MSSLPPSLFSLPLSLLVFSFMLCISAFARWTFSFLFLSPFFTFPLFPLLSSNRISLDLHTCRPFLFHSLPPPPPQHMFFWVRIRAFLVSQLERERHREGWRAREEEERNFMHVLFSFHEASVHTYTRSHVATRRICCPALSVVLYIKNHIRTDVLLDFQTV